MILTVNFVSGSTRTWVADKDYVLVGARGNAGNWMVTNNPTAALADLGSGTSPVFRTDIFFLGSTVTAQGAAQPQIPQKIPISAGETLFVSCSASGVCQLLLDEVVITPVG